MGRKIPGKKHRGVKDPEKQREKRLNKLQLKINAPPKNTDDQAIPKSLEHLIKLKNFAKNNAMVKKKKKKKSKLISLEPKIIKNMHPKAKPDKAVPIFKQQPGESSGAFLYRVNRETEAFLKETEFEKKYNVQVKRNPETGEIEGVEKAAKDELDILVKLKSKHKNINKKKNKGTENEIKLTKSQKRKQKLQLKKQKKLQDNVDEFKQFQENVEFGEIVHAPPELKIRPRKADHCDSTKPGKKGLLLNSLFEKENQSKKNTIDRSGKRKDLPIGERRQLEKQQCEVIAAYRKLKSNKLSL